MLLAPAQMLAGGANAASRRVPGMNDPRGNRYEGDLLGGLMARGRQAEAKKTAREKKLEEEGWLKDSDGIHPGTLVLCAILVLAGVLAVGLQFWRIFRPQREALMRWYAESDGDVGTHTEM